MIFQYEIDGQVKTIENVNKDYMIEFLNHMSPRGKSFCTLTSSEDSYIQCAGAKNKLTVEYRLNKDIKFRHFVLEKEGKYSEESSVRYSGGYITIKENEVLSYKDSTFIFETFLETRGLPDGYILRDITNMFIE